MNLKTVKIKSKKSIGIVPVYDICVPGPNHYFLESGVVSHNSGFVYASSILVAMKKLKLKEDEDGNKTSEVLGIRAGCKIMKTRYAKPFEDIQIQIPYESGMNPYSGFFDLIEKRELIKKEGNRYAYTDLNGEIHKYFRKEWNKNENGIMDLVMDEFHEKEKIAAIAQKVADEADDNTEV
jgi:hypothetical protein